jgi:hypothetical protein
MILAITAHPAHAESPVWPLIFVAAAIWYLFFGICRLSGWHLLAQRFQAEQPWQGLSWKWQSARFRGWFGYNNCLVIGADSQYLSIAMARFLGLPMHPPLRIPWNEIELETKKTLFGRYEIAAMRVGLQEQVSVRIYGKMVERLRQAAGAGWPLYQQEQAEEQGKPLYS